MYWRCSAPGDGTGDSGDALVPIQVPETLQSRCRNWILGMPCSWCRYWRLSCPRDLTHALLPVLIPAMLCFRRWYRGHKWYSALDAGTGGAPVPMEQEHSEISARLKLARVRLPLAGQDRGKLMLNGRKIKSAMGKTSQSNSLVPQTSPLLHPPESTPGSLAPGVNRLGPGPR